MVRRHIREKGQTGASEPCFCRKGDSLSSNTTLRVFCLAVALLMGLAAGGCAVGPDYVRPRVPEPTRWLEDHPAVKTDTGDMSRWWTVFNDPILNTLVETAYAQNLSLRIAGIRILEARAQLGIAVGGQYPQVQQGVGAYTYNVLSENRANTQPGQDFRYGDVSVGFDASWELDFWGKFRRAVESSVANWEASIAGYDDILVSLTAEVARTYVVIRTLEERLTIARENVGIQERSFRIADVRFRGGDVTELDVQQSRSLLANTQASIPRLEASLRQAKNSLAILLGLLPADIDGLLAGPGAIPAVPAEVVVGIPADLLRRRPDIRFAERQIAAQSARIGVAKADLYPHFTLFGSIGLRASDAAVTAAGFPGGSNLASLFESDSFEFFGGPAFTWDIFNYGRIKNRVRVEDARLQQVAVNYQNRVLRAAQEAEDALVAFVRSREEARFLAESAAAARRSVDLSLLQYREGLVDYQRVLDAQRVLVQEEDRFSATRGSVAVNLIAIYKALGGGWEVRVGNPYVPVAVTKEMEQRTDWGGLLTPEKVEPAAEKRSRWQWPDW